MLLKQVLNSIAHTKKNDRFAFLERQNTVRTKSINSLY